MFALGNVQMAQNEELRRKGRHEDAKAKMDEAYETHLQTLKLYRATLGETHDKVGDALHKLASHMQIRLDYDGAL